MPLANGLAEGEHGESSSLVHVLLSKVANSRVERSLFVRYFKDYLLIPKRSETKLLDREQVLFIHTHRIHFTLGEMRCCSLR